MTETFKKYFPEFPGNPVGTRFLIEQVGCLSYGEYDGEVYCKEEITRTISNQEAEEVWSNWDKLLEFYQVERTDKEIVYWLNTWYKPTLDDLFERYRLGGEIWPAFAELVGATYPGLIVDRENLPYILLSFDPILRLYNEKTGKDADFFTWSQGLLTITGILKGSNNKDLSQIAYNAVVEDYLTRQAPVAIDAAKREFAAELNARLEQVESDLSAERRTAERDVELYVSNYVQNAEYAADSALRDAVILREILND